MAKVIQTKKRLVTSFHNLSTELQEELKKKYPLGFTEVMMRVDKPKGDFFYAVPFETEEISYLVKIDVKIVALVIDADNDTNVPYACLSATATGEKDQIANSPRPLINAVAFEILIARGAGQSVAVMTEDV